MKFFFVLSIPGIIGKDIDFERFDLKSVTYFCLDAKNISVKSGILIKRKDY